jgi:hypothetical protein
MTSTVLHCTGTVGRVDEANDVSRRHNKVKLLTDVDCCEVGKSPIELRGPSLCPPKKVGIEIDANNLNPAGSELDSNPTESATSIKCCLRFELHYKIDFTVRVLAPFTHSIPARFIVIKVNGLAPLRPLR